MYSRVLQLPKKHSCLLLGPRQTGKSTLVSGEVRQHVWSVSLLETDQFFKYSREPSVLRREVSEKVEREGIKTVVIDEIQKVPALLDEVHGMIEKMGIRFILTGSSARKLRRGASNLLAGRALQKQLFPFVLPELLSFKVEPDLESLLRFGSLPAVLNDPNESFRKSFLRTYGQTYLKEEIQAEALVRNLGGFARFLELAANESGQVLNYSNIAREAAIANRSVQGYFDVLEDTLVGFRLPGWRKSLRKQLSGHPKFYWFDNGVCNALSGNLVGTPPMTLRGTLFEQWMISQIRALISYREDELSMFYWRTNNGAEVDLILAHGSKPVMALEFKSSKNVSKSDFSGLRRFQEEYPRVPSAVIAPIDQSQKIDQWTTALPWRTFLLRFWETGGL